VNDPNLDADTAERMLRGQATGSPELAKVLAAASSGLAPGEPQREEAAVAAFRAAPRTRQPSARRLSALLSLKAALIGLLLVLTGGVAVAATTQHLPGPLGHRHADSGRTPPTSQMTATPVPRWASPRPPADRDGSQATRPEHAPKKTHHKKARQPKHNKNKSGDVTDAVPVPSLGVRATPGLVVPGG
jgi:hypothetical protein